MNRKIDLHIHTNNSDGFLSPIEVVDVAVKNGVDTIAIADHDTFEAYSTELLEYAASKNINIIKAIEISTKKDKVGIHVLGYNIDLNNEELNSKLLRLRDARHEYLFNVNKKLNELGYTLNIDKLSKIETVTKAHIAFDAIENIHNKDLLEKHFKHIPGKGEFIETLMNENCPAYVKKETITPIEAADLIRRAGGKVILAHPVAYKYEDNLDEEDVLAIIKDIKADGIEANYIYIDRDNKEVDEIKKWNKFAIQNKLITTIGSDFHEEDGIHPTIGLNKEFINLSENAIDNIINKLLGKK